MDGIEHWRLHGKRHPVALRAVAQPTVCRPPRVSWSETSASRTFSCPANAAPSTPPTMCLYLWAQYDSMPSGIPQLADDAVQNALPERFKDPALLDEVQVMDYAEEQHFDEDDDTVDPEWVAADPQSGGSGHERGDSLGDVP